MPARERAARQRLFDALEAALPVRFVGTDATRLGDLDGLVVLPGADPGPLPDALPRLVATGDERPVAVPAGLGGPASARSGPRLALGDRAPLDRRLRGQRLYDEAIPNGRALRPGARVEVLAARGPDALWLSAPGPRDEVAVAPAELDEHEPLRERLRDGRFLAVAALVHFARAICAPGGWRPPPLKASFLFDDPNLHCASYGHLRYRELVREADRHEYHVAFATVPLDTWFAHPRAARLFRERSDRLSLVVHGNQHTRMELAQPAGAAERRALLAQALRRVAAFERRTGVPVGRVMVAPHGVCSQEMANDLVPLGFEALCISRPYPWLARPPRSWLAHPEGSSPLAGWEPASIVENGLPVILRRAFTEPVEDLALRAFLDQPLILYGHHGDMKDGIDRLAELATLVHGFGDVQWTSIADIAASNVATRVDGETLRVRMYTRRARVRLPAGVEHVAVDTPPPAAHGGEDAVAVGVPDATGTVEIRLERRGAPDAATIPAPGLRPWPVARRLMGEGRDRMVPLYRSLAARR